MTGSGDVEACCARNVVRRFSKRNDGTYAWRRHYGRGRRWPWRRKSSTASAGLSWQKWYAKRRSLGSRKQTQTPRASLGRPRICYRAIPHTRFSSQIPPSHPRLSSMSSDVVLPGQPVPVPRGPIPQIGGGIYSRDGVVRASLIGVPSYSGSVGLFAHFLPGRL